VALAFPDGVNLFPVSIGRAVRWGDPQVSRRGLTKGVFDSKYGRTSMVCCRNRAGA